MDEQTKDSQLGACHAEETQGTGPFCSLTLEGRGLEKTGREGAEGQAWWASPG